MSSQTPDRNEPPVDPVTYELACYIQRHYDRMTVNVARVQNLIRLSAEIYPNVPESQQIYRQDISRAAVVLLHATLEDFLRHVGTMYLPNCGEEVLNRVAIVGSSDVLRPEKFFLGRLASHRGKTVDQVISESVAAYLDRVSFSDTMEVSRLLEMIGVPLDLVRKHYSAISSLMARRHKIVHNADLIANPNDGPREAMPIDGSEVKQWLEAVQNFTSLVVAHKINKDFAPKLKKPTGPDKPITPL